MTSIEKIITLIEKEDCLSILAEDSFQKSFNELLKYGLIDIVEDKVVLTGKGKEAKTIGFEKVVAQMRREKKPETTPIKRNQKKSNLSTLAFGFLVALLIIFLVASPMGCGLIP